MTIVLSILGALLLGFAVYAIATSQRLKNTPAGITSPKILVLTDSNFQSQLDGKVVLVDFWADWCMPCKMMAPILDEVAEELTDNRFVAKINVEQFQQTAARYNIRNIPTMILFKDGKEVNRFVGMKPKDHLIKEINRVV